MQFSGLLCARLSLSWFLCLATLFAADTATDSTDSPDTATSATPVLVTQPVIAAESNEATSNNESISDTAIRALLLDLANDDTDVRAAAVNALVDTDDGRLGQLFDAYSQGSVYIYHGQAVIGLDMVSLPDNDQNGMVPLDALSRAPLADVAVSVDEFATLPITRKDRINVRDALVVLRLADPNPELRLAAVAKAGDTADTAAKAGLERRKLKEKDAKIARMISESLALIDLTTNDEALMIAASTTLADQKSARGGARMSNVLKENTTLTEPTKKALRQAIARIDSWGSIARGVGHVFSGLSLGSILVLMALGLSIIFGLMGVINMAHGEMMMIGAYSMWSVQQLLGAAINAGWAGPWLMEWSLIISLPVAFFASGFVGWAIEALVIRWLYGRPLDTLLATVGIGYILIQAVRLLAGDNNAVQSPSWLQGGYEVAPSIIFPYNRLFIIALCGTIVLGMSLLLNRTKMGLLLRATTQNRMMAQTLGVRTRRVDGMTFALGCGIAGLAGCALTLTDILKPDMGNSYIIESFMVVTAGGVGKLAGAVVAGFGLGFLNKALEPTFQAVWAKVWMLIGVIILLQWRPSGLFPAKGRLADV